MNKSRLKVAHFSFRDVHGAPGAAYELHKGLLACGLESDFFVREKTRPDDRIIKIGYSDSPEERLLRAIDKLYFDANRPDTGTAPVSFDQVGIPWTHKLENELKKYDLFHIHWVDGFLSINNIYQMLKLGKPVIWTMHDFHPFTGGCHCPELCTKYQGNCSDCPELKYNPADITKIILDEKKSKYLSGIYLTAASEWLKEIVHKSSVFRNHVCKVIPIGIDTDCFVPKKKSDMKERLGIPAGTKVILAGAQSLEQKVKGYGNLKQIFHYLVRDKYCKLLIEQKKLVLLTFGSKNKTEMSGHVIPVINMGFISDRAELCMIYNAADVFIFPSIQDTFGMTAVEAMSCGVPVVAFHVSAMKEVIIDGVNGYTAETGGFASMAASISHILRDEPVCVEKCRKRITDHYTNIKVAEKMTQYYHECLDKNTGNCLEETDQKNTEMDRFIHQCAFEIMTGAVKNKFVNLGIEEMIMEFNPEFISPEDKVYKLIQSGRISQEMQVHIYGAGEFGKRTIKALERSRIGITDVLDCDMSKNGTSLEGYHIRTPDEKSNSDGRKIIIAGFNYSGMMKNLINLGYIYQQDFY